MLQKLILESGIARHSAVMEVTDARIVEALCRFFYPLLAIFYHSLTAVFGTIVLLLVLGSLLSALKLRRTEILFPMLLLVMLSYMASSLYFRAGELIGRSGDYAGTFPFRYAYGVTLFCICAYVMAIEAFLRRRQASFKLAALSMLVVMVGSVLNVIASRKYEIRQMHPEHEQYISSFVDHKDVIRETVLVSVPNVQHNWHIEMPFVNFKATQDFLLKNYHECRIPTLDRMFSKENMYWKNCISKTRSAFYVHNTEENRKKFHKGAKIVLPAPYGERTIEGTREDRIFFDVYLSGIRLATDKAIDFDKCVVKYVE